MKKLHLDGVLFATLLVGVVVIAAGTGTLFGTTDTDGPAMSGESHSTGSDSMTVENVSVRNRTAEGVVYLDITAIGELDMDRLERSITRLHDDPTVNVSIIELVNVERNVATDGNPPGDSSNGDTKGPESDASVQQHDAADGDTRGSESSDQRSIVTVAIVTDDRSNSAHVVARVEHYLTETDWKSNQQTEQRDDSTAEYTAVSPGKVCQVTTAYYQVDFVVGEPIEQLQGPEGTYLPDELIRFAHGSTDEPIVRLSNSEFITHPELAERIESHAIDIEDGMATVTFSIAEGEGPIELSLVSYTKPGPGWSRAMEHLQVFVDADTETFSTGGPYTLHVDLPDAKVGPCKTPEPIPTSTAASANIPTGTVTVKTPPSTQVPTKTVKPQPSRSVELGVDWLSVYEGGRLSHRDTGNSPQAIFNLDDVKPGDEGKAVIRLHNRAGPSYIWMIGELTANDENGANEPERDAEAHPGGEGDGELAGKVDVTVYYAEYTGPGPYDVEKKQVITSGSLAEVMADLNNGIALDYNPDTNTRDPYPGHETGYLVFEWELPIDVGNEVQSDSVTLSLKWIAQQPHHNDGNDSNV